ncbi:MAG TPA: hypothetical protein VF765_15345 [Polyangiaceae bacterium]
MSLRFVLSMALVAGCTAGAAACVDDSVPSSFAAEAGSDGAGRPGDAASTGDSANLVGDAGPGSFYCGQTVCYAGYYCVRVLSSAGVEESAACYPLLQCSDCPCVTNVAATAYCSGDSLACAGQGAGPFYVTCTAAAPPGDAGGDG